MNVGYEAHLKLIDLVTKSMSQIYDKHERFQSLRHLSRLRRGLPLYLDSDGLTKFKTSLSSLLNEHKHADEAEADDDDDVFLDPVPARLSASEIAEAAKLAQRNSFV